MSRGDQYPENDGTLYAPVVHPDIDGLFGRRAAQLDYIIAKDARDNQQDNAREPEVAQKSSAELEDLHAAWQAAAHGQYELAQDYCIRLRFRSSRLLVAMRFSTRPADQADVKRYDEAEAALADLQLGLQESTYISKRLMPTIKDRIHALETERDSTTTGRLEREHQDAIRAYETLQVLQAGRG